jgi:hypothetical protein
VEAFVRPTIIDGHDYRLPDYPTRPIDEVTGLPYCFVPGDDLVPVVPRGSNIVRLGDWDHHYPKVETKFGANPILQEEGASLALMNLRVQWTNYDEHHNFWNDAPMIGPMQPASRQQLAATLLFGMSGYIPEIGLNLRNRKLEEQKLSNYTRRFLVESGQVRIADESTTLSYLRSYVMSQEVDHIKETELDEFLRTLSLSRRIYLGHCLAAKIIDRAVEPFDATYALAQKQGLLTVKDSVRGSSGYAPTNPRDLLKAKLTQGRRFGPIMNALAHRLAEHRKTGLRIAS